MCVPLDFEIEYRERHGFVVGYPEDAHIRELREAPTDKNRVLKGRVVVPWEDYDRKSASASSPLARARIAELS